MLLKGAFLVAGRKREDSKECWVAVSSRPFAEKLADAGVKDPDEAVPEMQKELEKLLRFYSDGKPLPSVVSAKAMKWGAAFKEKVLSERSLWDKENRVAACGDFCVLPLAEGALMSAKHLAEQILKA